MTSLPIADKPTLDLIAAEMHKAKRSYTGSFTCPASETLVTALSVTGEGTLVGVYWDNGSGWGSTHKITIDGVVILNETFSSKENGFLAIDQTGLTFGTLSNGIAVPIEFKESLLIEVAGESRGTTTWGWVYNLA